MSKHQIIKFRVLSNETPILAGKKTKIVMFQTWDLVSSLGSLHPNRNGHRSSEAQCNSRPLQLGNATLLKKGPRRECPSPANLRLTSDLNNQKCWFNIV